MSWYLGIGFIVYIWFYFEMVGWAQVGNSMSGGKTGTIRLLLLLPIVIIAWPFFAYMLIMGK